MTTRKDRGSETQKWVAEWYARLWPGCTSAGSGRSGQDVINAPVDIEVKARKGFSPLAAVKQLKERARGPFGPGWAVMRMDGQGEKHIGDFLVIMTLEDHTEYIAELKRLREKVGELAGQLEDTRWDAMEARMGDDF